MKSLAPLTALFLVLASCEDIPLALTAKEQVAEYKASSNPAAAPTFNPPANTYNTDQLITISSSTIGATLRYTTDGSVPNAQSPVYTGPVSVTAPGGVINAIAQKSGFKDSAVGTAAYTIDYDAVAIPQISPSTGTFSTDQLVSVTTSTTGAVIYYTLDGSDPTENSPVYSGPIPVAGHGTVKTVKALATKNKMKNSGVSSSTITISWPTVATPQLNPGSGTYSSDQLVTITTATPDAVIHYTNDGSVPTAASPIYSTPISVTGNGTTKTIQALAMKANMVDSAMGSATVVINYSQVSTVQFSTAPGTYSTNLSLGLSTSTPDASIYYTTDGSTPTVLFGTLYTGPISISGPSAFVNIKAIAVKGGMSDSLRAEGTFTVQWLQAEKPVLTLPGGGTDLRTSITFTSDTSVGLVSGTSGASIYYAVTPGTSGVTPVNLYGGTVNLTGSQTSDVVRTITAFTRKSGMLDSDLVTIQVTVAYPVAEAPTIGTGAANQGFSSDQAVPISSTLAESTTYYVTGGSGVADPTTASSVYVSGTTTIAVMGSQTGPQSLTVKAMTAKAGYKYSPVSTAVVTVTYPAVSPVIFSPSTTSWTAAISVSASSATTGLVQYYYTVDGSTPTTASPMVSPATPFSITTEGSTTVKVLARKSGMTDAYGEITYVITFPTVATPTFGVTPGNLTADLVTSITSSTAGTTIYYTRDGSTPSTSSEQYYSPGDGIGLLEQGTPHTYTLKAFAVKSGYKNSEVATAVYNVDYGATNVVTTLAGGGAASAMSGLGWVQGRSSGSTNGTGTSARFTAPFGIAYDGVADKLIVADSYNNMIRTVSSTGVTATMAGSVAGNGFSSRAGTGTSAAFNTPFAVAVDTNGVAYVADTNWHIIRKIATNGDVTDLAGSRDGGSPQSGSGDDTAVTPPYNMSSFNAPKGIAVDDFGVVYVADTGNHTIRRIAADGKVSTIGGIAGTSGTATGKASAALFNEPTGIAVVPGTTTLIVADKGNHRILRGVYDSSGTAGWVFSVLAGSGTAGYANATGAAAQFSGPSAVAVEGDGNVYVADTGNHSIRFINGSTGATSTLAGGTQLSGFLNGAGLGVKFFSPTGLAIRTVLSPPSKDLYIVDSGNHVLRRLQLEP